MKKKAPPKALRLSRETLRDLASGELRRVAGEQASFGDPISYWCFTSCRCTEWCYVDTI